jgi:hypothetical protein
MTATARSGLKQQIERDCLELVVGRNDRYRPFGFETYLRSVPQQGTSRSE